LEKLKIMKLKETIFKIIIFALLGHGAIYSYKTFHIQTLVARVWEQDVSPKHFEPPVVYILS